MMIVLIFILAFSCITGYVIHIASKHKALCSISESEYWLQYPWKWVFEAVMFITGGCIVYAGFIISKDVQWLMVSGGCGIIGVGIFARFKLNKFFKYAHYVCAVTGFASLGFSFIFIGLWPWTLVTAGMGLFSYVISRKHDPGILIWNLECILIYTIFIGYGLVLGLGMLK